MRSNLSVFGARFSQFPKRIASITSSRLSSQWLARQTRLDLSLSSTLFGFFDSLTVPRMRMNPRVRSDRTFGLDNTLEFRSLELLVLSVEVARTTTTERSPPFFSPVILVNLPLSHLEKLPPPPLLLLRLLLLPVMLPKRCRQTRSTDGEVIVT